MFIEEAIDEELTEDLRDISKLFLDSLKFTASWLDSSLFASKYDLRDRFVNVLLS